MGVWLGTLVNNARQNVYLPRRRLEQPSQHELPPVLTKTGGPMVGTTPPRDHHLSWEHFIQLSKRAGGRRRNKLQQMFEDRTGRTWHGSRRQPGAARAPRIDTEPPEQALSLATP